jgi:hypothetical protein
VSFNEGDLGVPAQGGSAVGLFVPIFYSSRQGVIHKRIFTAIPYAGKIFKNWNLTFYILQIRARDASVNPFGQVGKGISA